MQLAGHFTAAFTSSAKVPAVASAMKACLSELYSNIRGLMLVQSLHVVHRINSMKGSSKESSGSCVFGFLGRFGFGLLRATSSLGCRTPEPPEQRNRGCWSLPPAAARGSRFRERGGQALHRLAGALLLRVGQGFGVCLG